MKYLYLVCLLLLLLIPFSIFSQEYQSHFPPEEFKARWGKFFDKIGNEAVAVIQGATDPGGYVFPRQSNTFYYLCGVENMDSYLLLDGRNRKITLYLSPARGSKWERVLSLDNPEKVKTLTGVDDVSNSSEIEKIRARVIYTPFGRSMENLINGREIYVSSYSNIMKQYLLESALV